MRHTHLPHRLSLFLLRTPRTFVGTKPGFNLDERIGLSCSDSLRIVAGIPFPGTDGQPIQIDSTVTTILIDHVQRFVWGVAAAFDFQKVDTWELADRPNKDLTGTEKYVRYRNDAAGPTSLPHARNSLVRFDRRLTDELVRVSIASTWCRLASTDNRLLNRTVSVLYVSAIPPRCDTLAKTPA